DFLDLVAIDVADHKPGTLRGKAFGDGEPDALGGTRDDGDLVIQLHFLLQNKKISDCPRSEHGEGPLRSVWFCFEDVRFCERAIEVSRWNCTSSSRERPARPGPSCDRYGSCPRATRIRAVKSPAYRDDGHRHAEAVAPIFCRDKTT